MKNAETSFIQELKMIKDTDRILIVTHGGVIKNINDTLGKPAKMQEFGTYSKVTI